MWNKPQLLDAGLQMPFQPLKLLHVVQQYQHQKFDLGMLFQTYLNQLARTIAHAFVGARSIKPITTVGDVVKIIEAIVPGEAERHGVLARVFQGMRIATNDELGSLREGLDGAKELLIPGGKLVVISFHSLEDRIVKLFMRKSGWEVETVHPIRPTDEEAENNRRSRSAKLRIATKQNHETPATNR